MKTEINRILYMALQAVNIAERTGGMEARGWAKHTYDVIKGDIEQRYPEEDWS